MDGGVRETMCTHCIHREVCLYKQTYLEYLRASEKMYSDYYNKQNYENNQNKYNQPNYTQERPLHKFGNSYEL